MPRSYFSYGMHLDSFIPLDGLLESDSRPNVKIVRGKVRETEFYKSFPKEKIIQGSGLTIRPSKERFCVEWINMGVCLVERGRKVIIEPEAGTCDKQFENLVTGPIAAILLHQNNHLVLHGSVVNMNRRAVVFIGDKGYGKSTIAAHLQAQGYQLISDDLVPVVFSRESAETIPGHPKIRLYPDSTRSIGLNPENLPLVDERFSKRYVKLAGQFSTAPVQIGCIFVLNKADNINITPLKPSEAFIEIVRHTFLNRFIHVTENSEDHFRRSQKLLQMVPVFRLDRPLDFGRLDYVVERIRQHIFHICD